MNITSAKYIKSPMTEQPGSILATIDGQECFVPLHPGNRHYDEIMRQVDAGDLVIEQETQA
jgi:hypothetical protein